MKRATITLRLRGKPVATLTDLRTASNPNGKEYSHSPGVFKAFYLEVGVLKMYLECGMDTIFRKNMTYHWSLTEKCARENALPEDLFAGAHASASAAWESLKANPRFVNILTKPQ